MEAYKEYSMVRAVAKDRGISHDQAYLIGYSDFMVSVGAMFYGAHWQHWFQDAQMKQSQKRS